MIDRHPLAGDATKYLSEMWGKGLGPSPAPVMDAPASRQQILSVRLVLGKISGRLQTAPAVTAGILGKALGGMLERQPWVEGAPEVQNNWGEIALCRFMNINVWIVGFWNSESAVSMTRRPSAPNAVV